MREPGDYPPDHIEAMSALYDRVIDSPVTHVGVDWLARAILLLRIADHDVDLAGEVVHQDAGREAARREYDTLEDQDRRALTAEVCEHWASCVRDAILRLWHACGALQIDPVNLQPDHVALFAATLLNGASEEDR